MIWKVFDSGSASSRCSSFLSDRSCQQREAVLRRQDLTFWRKRKGGGPAGGRFYSPSARACGYRQGGSPRYRLNFGHVRYVLVDGLVVFLATGIRCEEGIRFARLMSFQVKFRASSFSPCAKKSIVSWGRVSNSLTMELHFWSIDSTVVHSGRTCLSFFMFKPSTDVCVHVLLLYIFLRRVVKPILVSLEFSFPFQADERWRLSWVLLRFSISSRLVCVPDCFAAYVALLMFFIFVLWLISVVDKVRLCLLFLRK